MRRVVVVSAYPDRIDVNMDLAYPWSLYVATGGDDAWHYLNLRRDWHLVAYHAVEQGWDEGVIVMGDDTISHDVLPAHVGHITSYTPSASAIHVCQRIFSATREGWRFLEMVWGPPYRGNNCELWQPDFVYERAPV